MNEGHLWCGSDEWRAHIRNVSIPWAIGDRDLGDDLLEIGPGYGATTDVFRERCAHVTAVEIDPSLARGLLERFAGSNVTVIEGDASALDFPDHRFSAVTSFHMLHHVPTAELQDRILAEAARVLHPGGLFVASDSIYSPELAEFHQDDTFNPLDPATVHQRLEASGFVDIDFDVDGDGRRWATRARLNA